MSNVPATVVLDGAQLCKIRSQLQSGNEELSKVLSRLTKQADEWLGKGPWSVTAKQQTPPSGNKNDYFSQAPYWWPSITTDGLPYMRRDGQINPDSLQCPDKTSKSYMFQSVYILALAWFYTGNIAYSKHCVSIIRVWFLALETRMRPHLEHAQVIPGANTGRAIGIIDFSQQYTSALDAVAILACGDSGWTAADSDAFRDWNVAYLHWLRSSPFGIEESSQHNNHGTFAALQKAGISLFLGDEAGAIAEVEVIRQRINRQISADGSQARELSRTRSWHYSCFNMLAFTRAACIASKVGIDLWAFEGPDGQSVHKAVESLIPYATGRSRWQHPELNSVPFAAYEIVRASAEAGSMQAAVALPMLTKPPEADDLWDLRPAPEQLDTVKI